MLFCLVVFFSNREFCEPLHPYYQHYHLLCNARVWKDTRVSKLHRCHFGVNYLFYTHFSSLCTLFCPQMVLKYQICVIQAESEAVHFSQQHDKLRHSVGLQDQP